ncbi:PREDICTED: MORN repeat-containing protein 3 isoform X3 [Myotis brandtii]|uniref:MORN repeat-containing protein 3 isoform X3 n=1 Tax=Myotis brandtii TaxID=109478 RepID=UPI000703CCF0|nr:PREDICTED: MORN repeat-containing protein 3 isoform X3 [Myotis brandtii]
MHEGRENGRVEVGEREEGRKDRGLHKGGSRGTEGNGQPGEIFQYRMWGSARKEAAPVRGSGAWEDGGGRREQGHLRAFRAMGSSFSDPMSITKVSGVATSAAGGAACTTAMVTSSRANGGTTSRTGRACRLKNGNRYEGYWQGGLKNGPGRFFHLDHGQLFEGFWVDNIAKCGTMIDFGRDEAPAPTQFPIPQVKIVDPDGVLEEALAMFKKKEEPSDTGTRRSRDYQSSRRKSSPHYPTAQTGGAPTGGVSGDSGHTLGILREHLILPALDHSLSIGASDSLPSWPRGPSCYSFYSRPLSLSARE